MDGLRLRNGNIIRNLTLLQAKLNTIPHPFVNIVRADFHKEVGYSYAHTHLRASRCKIRDAKRNARRVNAVTDGLNEVSNLARTAHW